jgi:7,8-dihydroneopterin aldolase/epimerase/oxygenase
MTPTAARTMTTTEQGPAWVPSPDTLRVTGIEVFAHHGVLEAERRDGQTFRVDLALGVDTAAAAATDDLARTVDYGSLVTDVVDAVASDPVDLIETVAERVAGMCLAREAVLWVEVTVHKPQAPIEATFEDVALTITRTRRGNRRRA